MQTNGENGSNPESTILGDCFGFVNNYFNNTEADLANINVDDNESTSNYSKHASVLPEYSNSFHQVTFVAPNYDDEPPLLDELEIYPHKIISRSLQMLNPLHHSALTCEQFMADLDLMGPVLFFLLYGFNLFLAGKPLAFGYVYGFSMISVFGMYLLLKLICRHPYENFISIFAVANALGYGISPILLLSMLGVFVNLNTMFGYLLAAVSIALSSLGASRMLCLMTLQLELMILIAYPTVLIYSAFALLTIF